MALTCPGSAHLLHLPCAQARPNCLQLPKGTVVLLPPLPLYTQFIQPTALPPRLMGKPYSSFKPQLKRLLTCEPFPDSHVPRPPSLSDQLYYISNKYNYFSFSESLL